MSDLAIGDIIQPEGETVPADLRDKYFIVRALEPEVELSWPYVDGACTVLYVPKRSSVETERDWLSHAQSVERREKQANAAIGLILRPTSPVLH